MKHRVLKGFVFPLLLLSLTATASFANPQGESLPKGFVYVDTVIPDFVIELRYATDHNFVGQRVDGYLKPRCIMTKEAAEALWHVQAELKSFGLGLKIFDAYRPQRAVDHFVRWAEDVSDTRTKAEFYPDIDKNTLFRDGYIAARSSHSRGSTVDLTLISLEPKTLGQAVDMGTPFDFFGPRAWPFYAGIDPNQRANRMLLHILMLKHGFKHYPEEWWHFTLRDEPFPKTYFDFPVQ